MSPVFLTIILGSYFVGILLISYIVSRGEQANTSFFIADRKSKWLLVSIGMIGTTISGITFISVPGKVGSLSGDAFSYFQFVMGNVCGFLFVIYVLLPIYYKLNVISIYEYIDKKLGNKAHLVSVFYFLLSRTIGAAFRFYLVVIVLQRYLFDSFGIPIYVSVVIAMLMIWIYTKNGGLKTIIFTDLLQTTFLIGALLYSIYFLMDAMNWNIAETFTNIKDSPYSKVFFLDDFLMSKNHFLKNVVGGALVTFAMVGLDQDIMQKNLSCKNLKESQKNMLTFTSIFAVINFLFLCFGALMYLYAAHTGIDIPKDASGVVRTDYMFPEIAINHIQGVVGVLFVLGLTAATFGTTDSALAALTTSYCIDLLGFRKKKIMDNHQSVRIRNRVYIGFCLAVIMLVLLFNELNNTAVVTAIFVIATYTYGPLLGIFLFALLSSSNRSLIEKHVIWICLLSPIVTYIVQKYSVEWFNYNFSFELILLNGGLTWLGLRIFSKKSVQG